ncbi:nitroreductase family protein [Eleftheria terrae]|uniref:nitroreductase family protein n=1 Tax=Eleftheria terrae TaxID=1597781 RepID=UPI00263B3857|nr:nitroreductase family protein [Eleftheria terrae]WKB50703.1 nitroreductase family protein [Eleftheria terrae]
MSHPVTTLIESRFSANHYDPEQRMDDDEITELVRLATLAPTAFHLQNWKFIAVRTPQAKARLKAVCYAQHKVVDAAVTFIICGTLGAHEGLAAALQPSVDAGIVEPSLVDRWVGMARQSHQGNPVLQRDEAVRSASLAAMTLMLAAEARGWATGPMSGFDPSGVAREFGLADNELPVILLTVGRSAPGNWPQKPRHPVHQVLAFA